MTTVRTKKISKIETEISTDNEIKEDLDPVIIIHGAASTKVGFGGEKFPRFVIPNQSTVLSERIKRFPLEGSRPLSEEWIKAFWDGIIAKLKVDISERKVLLSLPTAHLTSCPFRELAQEYFYNELHAKQIAVVSDPFLSLVNYIPQIKKLNAIIVDIGFSQIRIVPIYKAAILEDHIAQFFFGGFDLTKTLGTWLHNKGFEGPIDSMFLRDIKENYCFVRPFKNTISDDIEESFTYTLDKQEFKITSELWKLPELFFFKDYCSKKLANCPRTDYQGEKYDLNSITLSKAIGFVIKSLNHRLWDSVTTNICLTGGGTKFNGLYERLNDELNYFFPELSKRLKIHTSQNTDLVPFIGASKLVCLPSFQDFWRTKEEYETGLYDLFL